MSRTASPEDGGIMRARAILENIYTAVLTSSERTAWDTYLAMVPPQDATGSTYLVGTPTAFNQVIVEPPTLFAWGTIFGAYRFGANPPNSPSTVNRPTFTLTAPSTSASAVHLIPSASADTTGLLGILFYSTPPRGAAWNNTVSNSRPISTASIYPAPLTYDLTAALTTRWTTLSAGQVLTFYAHGVDGNGQLIVSPTPLTITLS